MKNQRPCSQCQTINPSDFGVCKRNKSGKDRFCLDCRKIKNRNYRLNNPEKVKAARKAHYDKNKERLVKQKIKWANKPENKEKKAKYDVEYRKNNKEKFRAWKKKWEKKTRNSPLHKLKRNLRRRIHHVIKQDNKSRSSEQLLGCTYEKFMAHIESQFENNMSWDNYGQFGWHVDHIIPCFKFDLTDPVQQEQCFNYKNMRPLWWQANLKRKRNEN